MRALCAGFIAAASAVAAFSQVVAPGALTAEVDVHVINVDVSVTDAHGKPVSDLTRDDFLIFEDGKPQKLTNFALIQQTAPGVVAAESSPMRPASDRRRILLIVDNNYLSVVDRNRALDTVEKYLSSSFSGEWAVAAVGHSAEMLQSFTSDKALVRKAIASVRQMPSSEAQHKIDRSILSERFTRSGDVAVPEDYKEKVAFSSREQTFRNLTTIENTARAVVDTARSYAAEDGKKFIILLTGGMELNTTFTQYDKNYDYELNELKKQIGEVVDAMVREANGANFTLHVVNAATRGMAAPQHDTANRSTGVMSGALLRNIGNDPIDVSNLDSIPVSIALGTGGSYLPSSDIRESLQRIDSLTSNFYSLGYSPDHNGDGQYHTISVRVKRSGVRVANRVGYFDETPEARLEQMLRVRMKFDDGFGSIPVKLEVGQPAGADADMLLPVTTVMPLARITVIPQDDGFVGRVHVYCSVFDGHGNNVGFSHQEQKVTMSSEQVSSPGDFRYTLKVRLKPGTFTIVITLRDELSNELGSASEAVRL